MRLEVAGMLELFLALEEGAYQRALEKLCWHFLGLEKLETRILGEKWKLLVPKGDRLAAKLHIYWCGALCLEILGDLA